MIVPAASAFGGLEARWVPVQIFAVYQRMLAEMFYRGRLRDRLADAEAVLRLRHVSTEPLAAGVPRLSNASEAVLNRDLVGAVGLQEAEPRDPDEPAAVERRALFQGAGFTVTGLARFPAGAEADQHLNLLQKSTFWPVAEARVGATGSEAPALEMPLAWVNQKLVVAVFLA